MGEPKEVEPPAVHSRLIRTASWLVPRKQRTAWLDSRESALKNWWILVGRGEFPAGADREMARESWHSFAEAFYCRFEKEELAAFARTPTLVYLALAASLLVVALASHGFSATRALWETATSAWAYSSLSAVGDAAQDRLMAHALPMGFAGIIGLAIFLFRAGDMHWYGWKYWLFFSLKLLGVAFLIPAIWVEIMPLVRRSAALGELVLVILAVTSAFAFIAAFGWAIRWAVVDQRERCPVCLARLGMPVRIGSWASVFEPATTEFLCPEGHGTLCVLETEDTEPEQWSALDPSWRELFEPAAK